MGCNKKAQGSMEFLMTYGWALLVVLVAIGALTFYFGFDSNFLANEGCYMQPGFFCGEYKIDEGSVMVKVTNSLGRGLSEVSISHPSCSQLSDSPSLEDGRNVLLTTSGCNFGVEGNYMEETFVLNYTFLDSSLNHISDFKIGAIIEGGNSQLIGGGGQGYQPDSNTVLLLKFEEGSGTNVYDSSSHENNGNFNGEPSWEDGYFGTAIHTDGLNDVVRIPHDESFNFGSGASGTRAFTIEGWIKTTDDNIDGLIGKRSTGPGNGYSIGIQGGKMGFALKTVNDYQVLLTDSGINDGAWHHFAFVFDELLVTGTVYSFVDGVKQTTELEIPVGFGDFSNTELLRIGKRQNFFAGTFDEIRLSDFARW